MSDETIIGTGISAISTVEKYNDLFSQGDLCFWKCEYKKAKEHFQAALNQPSISLLDSARCYNSLGAVNAKLKNYEEALNSYHRQLDLLLQLETSEKKENDIAKCNMSIGKIYWLKQEYTRAIDCYNKVLAIVRTITLAPDLTSNIHKDLANLYTKTQQFDLALVHFEKALNIDRHQLREHHPKLGQTYANIGVMYYSQQDYEKALNYFEQALTTWRKSLLSTHVYIESMEKTIRTVQSKIPTVQPEPSMYIP
jgi:tetratricopeptide (TPR) repeat protein